MKKMITSKIKIRIKSVAAGSSTNLSPGEVAEGAGFFHELFVPAGLGDPAILDDVDAIGIHDCVEPMGDDDSRDASATGWSGCR